MPPLPPRHPRRGRNILTGLLVGSLAGGCATPSKITQDARHELRHIPTVPAHHTRTDQAILAAFFAANGATLTQAEIEQIIPPANAHGQMDRNAIRRIATQKKRVLMTVKADECFLWEKLCAQLPLLLLLPPSNRFSRDITLVVPLAVNLTAGTIELLDGKGEILTLPTADFFARREPLKQAALCLIKPGQLSRQEPTREQKLLLADFWFSRKNYARAHTAYASIQPAVPSGQQDVASLTGRGNILVRQGRYAEAIPCYRAALALERDNPQTLNNLAYAMLHGKGELLTALRHAQQANQLDPENPVILETLGSINLKLGDTDCATRYLEQAWARANHRPPEIQMAIMDQLTRAWLAADRRDLAWQVAAHRHRTFPEFRIPKDILSYFPDLKKRPQKP